MSTTSKVEVARAAHPYRQRPRSGAAGASPKAVSAIQRAQAAYNPKRAAPGAILNLQRRYGNRAVQRLIQRHSSFEHALLGDVDPDQLQVIPNARFALEPKNKVDAAEQKVLRDDAVHVIRQEMTRLKQWQADPPKSLSEAKDWQVRLVAIPYARDPARVTMATYGEINTLPDLFGSVDDLKRAEPKTVHGLLQGIRQQIYLKLEGLLAELTPHLGEKVWATLPTYGFSGTQGATGRSDPGPIPLGDMRIDWTTKGDKNLEESKTYFANVGRNACHFAPQSWYNWKEYHEKARQSARDAHQVKQDARRAGIDAAQGDQVQKLSEQYANEAWLNNGFGDHYLQDSFAGGHLVNKTLIMQWFVEWVEKGNHWDYVTDATWARQRQMAEKHQPGLAARHLYSKDTSLKPSDPQTAENQATRSQRREKTGLIAGASGKAQQVLLWWTRRARDDEAARNLYPEKLAASLPRVAANSAEARQLLEQLVTIGLAENKGWVDRNLAGSGAAGRFFGRIGNVFRGRQSRVLLYMLDADKAAALPASPDKLEAALEEDAYKNYHLFLNSAFIQASTRVLHDKFCQEGLMVGSEDHPALMKIYGDENMLNADPGEAVKYSAQTARMSQQAIAKILEGREAEAPTVEAIFKRLPSKVYEKNSTGGETISLADWHTDSKLRAFAEKSLFTDVVHRPIGFFLGLKGDVAKISQDKHDAGPF